MINIPSRRFSVVQVTVKQGINRKTRWWIIIGITWKGSGGSRVGLEVGGVGGRREGVWGAEGGGFGPAEAEADPVETEKAYR